VSCHAPTATTFEVPGATPDQRAAAAAFTSRLMRLPTLAHHCACPYWSNHLIYLGSRPLCLGCTCMYPGIVLGLIVSAIFLQHILTPWQLFLAGFVAYTPTLVQVFYQKYAFKIVARFLLGNGIAFMLFPVAWGYSWASLSALANLGFLVAFVALYVFTTRLRNRHIDIPCLRCPEGRFPFCSWRHQEIKGALREYERDRSFLPDTMAQFLYAMDTHIDALRRGEQSQTVQFMNVEPHSPTHPI
jgi:hypothetical protein